MPNHGLLQLKLPINIVRATSMIFDWGAAAPPACPLRLPGMIIKHTGATHDPTKNTAVASNNSSA